MSNPYQQPNYGQGNYGNPPNYGQGNFGQGSYGQGNYGQGPPMNYGAYGPPPPSGGKNWVLIALGLIGGGGLLILLACCGGLMLLGQTPQASAQASQPFETATVPLPAFPPRGMDRDPLDGGVLREEVLLSEQDEPYNPPGHGGILWLYLPEGQHAPGSLPCVLICGAGSTLLEGMTLSEGDEPEHIPYVKAGFAVVAYELDGDEGLGDVDAYNSFKNSRAGLVNARNALEFVLAKVPEVNPKKIYSAGHSSAGTMSLLFAEHEPRLAGCIAFAPCSDVQKFIGGFRLRMMKSSHQGIADFVVQSSPKTHASRLSCPVFLFHAHDDEVVDVAETEEFASLLRLQGRDVTLKTVPSGGHYDSMIGNGIPAAIDWLKLKTNKP